MIGVLSKFYLTLHHPFLASWQCSFLCLVFCRNVFLSMHSPLLSLHAVSLPLCLIHLILCLIWLYYHSLISRAAVLYQDLKWLLQQIYPSCDNLFFWCVPFGYLYFYYFSYFSKILRRPQHIHFAQFLTKYNRYLFTYWRALMDKKSE